MIVLINGIGTVGRLYLLFQLTAGFNASQKAGSRGGVHSVVMHLDV